METTQHVRPGFSLHCYIMNSQCEGNLYHIFQNSFHIHRISSLPFQVETMANRFTAAVNQINQYHVNLVEKVEHGFYNYGKFVAR